MPTNPETGSFGCLPKLQPETPYTEAEPTYPSPAEWFVKMAEEIKVEMQTSQDYDIRRLTPREWQERVQGRITNIGVSLEEYMVAQLLFALRSRGLESGLKLPVDLDQARQEVIELDKVMLKHGVRPKFDYWAGDLSEDGHKLYEVLAERERKRKRIEYTETFDFDLDAAYTELMELGALETDRQGYRLLRRRGFYHGP